MKTPKRNLSMHLSKWNVYKFTDFTVAFMIVAIAMASADIPRKRIEIRPRPTYGPPPKPQDGTTTPEPTTTENVADQKSENLEVEEDVETLEEPQRGGHYYLLLPRAQNLVYTVPRSAAVVAVPFSSVASSSVVTPFSASYVQIYQ